MATYFNRTRERIALATGYLDGLATVNADPADPAIVSALADGDILLVDGNVSPPSPPTRKVPVVQDVEYASGLSQVDADEIVAGRELDAADSTTSYGSEALVAFVVTDVPGMVITVDCDGVRPIEVEFEALFQKLAGTGFAVAYIFEGANKLKHTGTPTIIAGDYCPIRITWRGIPTAGVHTFKACLVLSTTGGRLEAGEGEPAGPTTLVAIQR